MSKTFRVLGVALACLWLLGLYSETLTGATALPPTEAPTGFDTGTNGVLDQASFDTARTVFEERDDVAKGLGPVYNAQSCAECHANPVTGGISQIVELRAGHFDGISFIDHPGGSLINDRATDARIQEVVLPGNEVRTFRTSLNTLGDGFVEAIDDATFTQIRTLQPPGLRGQIISVPVAEAIAGTVRVGRFGWKNQNASLLSFSGDAYLNEQGVTNRLFLTENTSNGNSVAAYDPVPDTYPYGEDPDNDVDQFAAFMRSTKAPPRGPITAAAIAGQAVFNAIGCSVCHTPRIVTAPAGTLINGDMFTVPPPLGNKIIHPFGDFMLHDVGTGDGIVQNGGPATRNKLRTPPLWGVRTRTRLMHDGGSLTFHDAILRHAGQAAAVTLGFRSLDGLHRGQLLAFLGSL
jgi:CxxC motif-containing protein (DUF1111 family)